MERFHRRTHHAGIARKHALAAALLILTAAAFAHAESDDDATQPARLKELSLEELSNVEVTSVSRRPEKLSTVASAIQVITSDEIRRSGATSLPEALRLADNLDVAQKNSHDWAVTARGFNTALANKLLVMIDGRTVYTPLFSGVFWDVQNVLLEDIDRIEVISGPGGTLWGANAVNGVINIITKSSADTQGAYVEAGAGDSLRDSVGARYGARVSPDVTLRVYGQSFDRDEEEKADGDPAHDDWRHSQAGFRLDAGASPSNRLTVQGDYYDGDENIVSGGKARVDGANLLGRWSHVVSDRSDFSLQVYYDRTHLSDPIPALVLNGIEFAPAGNLIDDLDTFDVDFQQRLRIADSNEIVWGFGYRHTRDEVSNAPALAFLPATLDQNLYSAFIQDEAALRDNLALTFGTKLEHNDYTGFELEPSLRLQWTFAPSQSLWAAVSRAVRTPSRVDRDLVEPAPPQALVVLEGSSDFSSESVVAKELGYRAQLGSSLALSITAFHNDYHDVRSTGITPATLLPFVFENNLEGATYGAELSADVRLAPWWRLRAGFDSFEEHLHVKPGQFDLNDAHNETADPSHRWSIRSSMDLGRQIELDIGLRRVGARDINNGPTIGVVPAYTEMDLRLGWRATEHLELSIVGANLLHERHVEYGYPDGNQVEIGRSVFGKIAWRY